MLNNCLKNSAYVFLDTAFLFIIGVLGLPCCARRLSLGVVISGYSSLQCIEMASLIAEYRL